MRTLIALVVFLGGSTWTASSAAAGPTLFLAGQEQQNPAPSFPATPGQPTEPVMIRPTRPPSAARFPDEPPQPEARLQRPPFNAAKARQQARELADLASKIPSEIDQVSKNVLPKDLDEQLKRIQKLAKQLRSQLAQ